MDWIEEVERHTVRVKRHQCHARHIRDQAVDVLIVPFPGDPLARIVFRHPADVGRVSLPGQYHSPLIHADRLRHPAVILPHMVRIVPL